MIKMSTPIDVILKRAKSQTTTMKLLVVDHYEEKRGVSKPIYKEAKYPFFNCNFKTYGGTETTIDGRYVIEDTADIITRYRPDIQSDCQVIRLRDNAKYEIINEPEIFDEANQWMIIKLKRVKGRA